MNGARPPEGRTLLLAGSIPGSRNVGQILLRDMLACVDADRFAIAALLPPNATGEVAESRQCRVFPQPYENATRRWQGRLGGLSAAVVRLREYEPAVAKLADEVASHATAGGFTRIWATLNSTTAIDVCERLVDRLHLPLLAHVWDDVEFLTRRRDLDALTRRRTERRLGRILACAERTAVIGETMATEYAKRYGARCQIVRHGISDKVAPRESQTGGDEFVIGFSGSMYCPSAWKAFHEALARLGWKVGTKRLRLVVMGHKVSMVARTPALVEFLGWRSDDEVQARLADCDLLYLPQPFEPGQRPMAEFSFPTKYSAYVASGRPVLVHAPEYASLPVFVREHGLGSTCTQLDPDAIAAAIIEIALDEQRYRDAARASATIASTVLSRGHFAEQVRAFLR